MNISGKPLIVAAKILGFIIVIAIPVLVLLWCIALTRSKPREVQLIEFTNMTSVTRCVWPLGSQYEMVLAIPANAQQPDFIGRMIFEREGVEITNQLVSARTATPYNWLSPRQNLNGFMLSVSSPNAWEQLFTPGVTYDVTIVFDRAVPKGCALWLKMRQTGFEQMRAAH